MPETAFVQPHRRVHAGQGLQVAMGKAETAGSIQAARHHRRAGAQAAYLGQEIHLAQFAGVARPVFQRGDTAPAQHHAVALDHEVGTARRGVGAAHPVHFGIADGEAAADRAELGHDGADDGGDPRIVLRADRPDQEWCFHGNASG